MIEAPLAENAAPPVAPQEPHWVIGTSCPPEWQGHLERCGGGFFHSPLGLLAGAPAGQPLFAQLLHKGRVVAVAAGVRHGCRFSLRPRHVYFPSLPAFTAPELRGAALRDLVAELRRQGAVEVVIDSLDAASQAVSNGDGIPGPNRIEFRVRLAASAVDQPTPFHPHHGRQLHRATDAGWTLGMLGADDARAMLTAVQASAPGRSRGDDEPPPLANIAVTRLGDPWGAAVFGAWKDSAPLAAALVGWANRRACFISGGSTREGAQAHAASWMQWRIMAALRSAGFISYNLGGTPAEAARDGHPEHERYEFLWRLCGSGLRCCGARWPLQARHARTHRFVAEIMGNARSEQPRSPAEPRAQLTAIR